MSTEYDPIFIYDWQLEDVYDEVQDSNLIKVRGYGLNLQNQPVYLEVDNFYFKPWLSIQIIDTKTFSISKLKYTVKSIFNSQKNNGEEEKNVTFLPTNENIYDDEMYANETTPLMFQSIFKKNCTSLRIKKSESSKSYLIVSRIDVTFF